MIGISARRPALISFRCSWAGEAFEPTASTDTIDNLKLLRGRVVRLQLLLDGLLAYARSNRSKSSFEKVDVAEVVRDVVAVLSPPAGFDIVCEGDMPTLRTHRTSVLVVMQNLISNAIKHHDRAEGRVTISMRKQNGIWEFRVSDDGPGIPAELKSEVFERFARGDSSRSRTNGSTDVDMLEHFQRDDLNRRASRAMAVLH